MLYNLLGKVIDCITCIIYLVGWRGHISKTLTTNKNTKMMWKGFCTYCRLSEITLNVLRESGKFDFHGRERWIWGREDIILGLSSSFSCCLSDDISFFFYSLLVLYSHLHVFHLLIHGFFFFLGGGGVGNTDNRSACFYKS